MFGFFAASRFYDRLETLERKSPHAKKVGATECQKCGFCCWRAPGGFQPEDVQALARRMKLSVQEVFERYLTVHDMGQNDDLYAVIAIRHRQSHEAGDYLSASGSFDLHAPCVFLDEGTNLCTLHNTDAQPSECRDNGVTCLNMGEYPSGKSPRIWTPEMLQATFNFDINSAKCGSYED